MVDRQTLAAIYREKAERCRRLARQTTDREIANRLLELAVEFEERAAEADNREA
jgi:hypothetical protein